MEKVKMIALMCILLVVVGHSWAATVICTGTVAELAFHANGRLMVRLSSMNTPVFICSPDQIWTVPGTPYTTSPATCNTLYSTFLAARVSGIEIRSMYFDGDEVPATCNSWASWGSANVRFFKM